MRKLVGVFFILAFVSVFPVSSKAYSYYTAAMAAMQMKDCGAALQWFEKALLEDPAIEDVDPYIKLWIGVCAYELKDYTKAQDFLKLFPDNELAKAILLRMKEGLSPEEKEWDEIKEMINQEKSYLKSFSTGIASTPTTATTNEREGNSFLVFIGLFIVIFSSLMIVEMKFGTISTLLAKIPRVRIVFGNAEVVKEVVHETMREPRKEELEEQKVEEKEVEVDIEELFNTPLDTVDKLIYGEDFVPEVQEEEIKTEEKSEIEMVTQELGSASADEEHQETQEEVEEKEETSEKAPEGVVEEEKPQEEVEEKEPEKVEEASEKELGESLTEEDLDEVEKKAKEILESEGEEEELGIPVELAGMDADEILKELEDKDEYDEEDASKLLYAIQKLVEGEDEEKESEEEG